MWELECLQFRLFSLEDFCGITVSFSDPPKCELNVVGNNSANNSVMLQLNGTSCGECVPYNCSLVDLHTISIISFFLSFFPLCGACSEVDFEFE